MGVVCMCICAVYTCIYVLCACMFVYKCTYIPFNVQGTILDIRSTMMKETDEIHALREL